MKIYKIAVFVIMSMFVFSVTAFSAEYESDYYDILTDGLSRETVEILEQSGLDSIDFEKILSAQPKDIVNFFKQTAKGNVIGPFKHFTLSSAVSVAVSVCFSYLSENEKKKKAVTLLVYSYIALSVCVPMSSLLSAGAAAIQMSSKFMFVFLPVLAGIIAAANNPMLALNYNTITLYLAEIISAFSSNLLLPFEGMVYAFVCVGSVSDTVRVNNFGKILKGCVTKTLSVLATVFTAFLSIKGILSNAADTVASKGAKLLVSSLVPIIGGSMSEAYGSIVNSLSLLKSSVGIFGIIIIAAINLPVVTELAFWSVSLTFSGIVADIFNLKNIADLYREISNVVKTFNVILLFCCMLFIVSTGILITIRNNA